MSVSWLYRPVTDLTSGCLTNFVTDWPCGCVRCWFCSCMTGLTSDCVCAVVLCGCATLTDLASGCVAVWLCWLAF